MKINIEPLTNDELMQRACSFTAGKSVKPGKSKMYDAEHSPIRCMLFWVEMFDIPSFVSTHFARHKVGVEHFVKSNREDRGGDETAGRWTPVNHAMLCNAQALMNMARARLCGKAHIETQRVMYAIKQEMKKFDADLAQRLVPKCRYRNGVCGELYPCGQNKNSKNNLQITD